MMDHPWIHAGAREAGQVIPLFVLLLVVLLGMAALAIDVSGVYSTQRYFRSVADSASLAGAQDLQTTGTRAVSANDQKAARGDALALLINELGASGPPPASACNGNVTDNSQDLNDCALPGTGLKISIKTPSPSCVDCGDPAHAVQVTVRNPTYELTFSRLFHQFTWNVGETSVAGLGYHRSYTIVTLRPPTSATIPGVRDIAINGGTKVNVIRGDVATNANMLYSGTNSILTLQTGYNMDYYDPANPPLWGSSPPGNKIKKMVKDPGYPIPSRSPDPGTAGEDPSSANCQTIAEGILANADYAPSVPVDGLGAPDMTKITCYLEGIYSSPVTINNGTLGILEPGLYFFDAGLNVQGSVIGGYTPNSPGVALVFPETSGTMFKNRTSGGSSSLAQLVALNAGTRYSSTATGGIGTGSEASAALDYSGNPIQTNTPDHTLMTVIVPPDANCPVKLPLPASCSNNEESKNIAVDLSGGSSIYLAGVQYGPSDNMSIAGNSTTGGYVGQVWAWTLVYTGGSIINQEGVEDVGPGILRLDAACTAPGTDCHP